MSGVGAPAIALGDVGGLSVAIVAAKWHARVMQGLVDGATGRLADAGLFDPLIVRVPGAFELPLAVQAVASRCDAVVALGVVIRGGTPHFDYVCRAATDGLMRVGLDSGASIGFGLLTCDTEEQALARAGLSGSTEDKGAEAVEAALTQAVVIAELRSPGTGASLDQPL